ncbi:MAG: nitroreductase family protein [Christensenellales bacterium]|jgi:nitroreductase
MENAVLDAIFARSSIRAYTDQKLTAHELDTLKKAALAAPTGSNRQENRFFFITDRQLILKVEAATIQAFKDAGDTQVLERIASRNNKVIYDAPLYVVIAAKQGHSGTDAGIAVQNLAIAAKGMGLDSVILGLPKPAFSGDFGKELRDRLGFEEGYVFAVSIAIGHGAMEKAPHEWDEGHVKFID